MTPAKLLPSMSNPPSYPWSSALLWRRLPLSSGVYWFKDSATGVLYVGKAKNLKHRLRSYQQPVDPKTKVLVTKIRTVNWLTTASELDALLLEAAYIKAFQPPYNVRLKDDKSQLYIAITQETYPRVLTLRKSEVRGQYFGPFSSAYQTKNLLRALRHIFPWCNAGRVSSRPCFYYHLRLCPGVCVGAITPGQYRRRLRHLITFLSGQTKTVIRDLTARMRRLSRRQNFEAAALIRDQLAAINYLHQTPPSAPHVNASQALRRLLLPCFPHLPAILARVEAYDVSHLSGRQATGSMIVFTRGQPDTTQYRRFRIKSISGIDDPAMMTEVLQRRLNHPEWDLPDLILLDGGLPQLTAGSKTTQLPLITLAKRQETIFTPQGPLKLSRASPALKMLQHLRDEAHRFARSYHRQLRDVVR